MTETVTETERGTTLKENRDKRDKDRDDQACLSALRNTHNLQTCQGVTAQSLLAHTQHTTLSVHSVSQPKCPEPASYTDTQTDIAPPYSSSGCGLGYQACSLALHIFSNILCLASKLVFCRRGSCFFRDLSLSFISAAERLRLRSPLAAGVLETEVMTAGAGAGSGSTFPMTAGSGSTAAWLDSCRQQIQDVELYVYKYHTHTHTHTEACTGRDLFICNFCSCMCMCVELTHHSGRP